jgi:tryptophan synthase alpha chain
MNSLRAYLEDRKQNGRKILSLFVTAGYPSRETTVPLVLALAEAGADLIELGVPFSDPIADGPVLQRAAGRALRSGTTLTGVFEIGRRIRSETGLALVLFTYLNPLLRAGIGRAAGAARDAGFDGALVTDLPPEEAGEYREALRSAGLDTVFLVSPTSTSSRMSAAARLSSGFLYVVSRPGTTGARRDLPADLPETIRRARRAARSLPIAVGFGIATPPVAATAARLADGVVVGSALVRAAEEAGDRREESVEALARSLADACRLRRTRAAPSSG